AWVERITHLGFEVRVDLKLNDGSSTWVQLSRGGAAELDAVPGDQVWVSRATPSKRQGALTQVVS
ncbi:MAG TPA: TOBE domain-containing protein, partial [Acidimicrobiales bacterium]|nr:TOBE domain-containing protein [Acidimicrobiales bacterium]